MGECSGERLILWHYRKVEDDQLTSVNSLVYVKFKAVNNVYEINSISKMLPLIAP